MRAEPFTLVQLVPTGHGGVRDYADCLQAEWQRCGRRSALLELSNDLARQRPLAERIDDAVAAWSDAPASRRVAVVLHYSGYGYEKRGLCFWLLQQIPQST